MQQDIRFRATGHKHLCNRTYALVQQDIRIGATGHSHTRNHTNQPWHPPPSAHSCSYPFLPFCSAVLPVYFPVSTVQTRATGHAHKHNRTFTHVQSHKPTSASSTLTFGSFFFLPFPPFLFRGFACVCFFSCFNSTDTCDRTCATGHSHTCNHTNQPWHPPHPPHPPQQDKRISTTSA